VEKITALEASFPMIVISNALGRNNRLGAAAVIVDYNQKVIEYDRSPFN
jgi:hypothetical protein